MEYHVCDACGHEAGGWSKEELKKAGWEWQDARHRDSADNPIGQPRFFVLCDECVELFAQRRGVAA